MRVALIHPGAIGDLVLALPLAQTLAGQGGLVELFAAGDRAKLFAGRSAISAGHSLDSLSLAPLFSECFFDVRSRAGKSPIPRATGPLFHAAEYPANDAIETLASFDRIICAYQSEALLANLRRLCPGRVDFLDVRPASIAAAGRHASDFLHHQLFGCDAPDPILAPHPHDILAGRSLLAASGKSSTVLVHPGSGGKAKCWPLACFVKLAMELTSAGWFVAFALGPAERERFSPADLDLMTSAGLLLPELSLEELFCEISAAGAFIGNDSGPTHLAAAAGRATLAIFGPTNPRAWRPRGPRAAVAAGDPSAPNWRLKPSEIARQLSPLLTT